MRVRITDDYVDDIRYVDRYRHKYGDAMAEYLDVVCMSRGGDDASTGDVEWTEYVQRFGKRLLFTDGRGFVDCERWPTVAAASARFDEIDAAYGEWANDDDDTDDTEDTDDTVCTWCEEEVAIITGYDEHNGAWSLCATCVAHREYTDRVQHLADTEDTDR